MKNIILGTVSAVALLAAGSAFAAGSTSTVTQSGVNQVANVDQVNSSSGAVSTITQADGYNLANVTQAGSGNTASVDQAQDGYGATHNPSNTSVSDQEGVNSNVTVIQRGNSSASVLQTGSANSEHAIVFQQNNDNLAGITQQGQGELALVNQEAGTGNVGTILQNGTGDNQDYVAGPGPGRLRWHENLPNASAPFPLSPPATTYGPDGATIDQVGTNNFGQTNQSGYQNFADIAQGDVGAPGTGNVGYITQGGGQVQSDAIIFQNGSYNTASISQLGSGASYSAVWSNGVANQGYSTQTGNADDSSIEQGFTDGNGTEGATTNNDVASVNQSGNSDLSEVNQFGSFNTANVVQSTNNDVSHVWQSGSGNLANVHQ